MNADEVITDSLETPQPDEPGFEEAIHAEFAQETPEAPATEQPEEEVQPSPEPSPEAVQEPAAPAEPTEIDIGGVSIPADRAQALAEFWNWSQSPAGQPWMYALHTLTEQGIDPATLLEPHPTRPEPTPPPETAPQPAYEEYVDPSVQAAVQKALAPVQAELESFRTQVQAQQAATAQAMITTASQRFAETHRLSAEEANQIVSQVDRTMNVAGYSVDPSGARRDGVETLLAAMEAALWANPDMRERELERVTAEQKETQKKARKLASVGGTSGSVPHKPVPQTAEGREQAAYEMLSEAMGFAK